MSTNGQLRVRRSLQDLQDDYAKGTKKPLEDLMRAWKGIKELPPDNPRSFFMLGGFHGEPFRGAGWGNAAYWGGWCQHGNILFPPWHRAYLVKLEEALQSIPECGDVMMPYWDETSDESAKNGVPSALTQETFVLDGATIKNPLRSFMLPRNITDEIGAIDANNNPANYSKPMGYETVRYPLSGLVGTDEDKAATTKHNALYPIYAEQVAQLNLNVRTWLNWQVVVKGKVVESTKVNVRDKYKSCLDAPNYTVFSNTTSAQQWNDERLGTGAPMVVPLESPHNSIHLAVGGIDVPSYDRAPIEGANGDMGENDTAALDPIFYFHHCFVDRVFWLWQKKHGFTDQLDVIEEYPGTNSVDSQGPTPGTMPNSWLTLDSPLNPFKKKLADGSEKLYTSRDCINIEKQLGYTYAHGSLEDSLKEKSLTEAMEGHSTKVVSVSGINRGAINGSFLVCVYATIDGERHLVGTESVLSRWKVQYCANCQTHLEVKAFVGLHGFREELLQPLKKGDYEVEIRTHAGVVKSAQPAPLAAFARKPFYFEVG